MTRVLDGVKVVDFTQFMQGPWATQKLGDMGADVIKIEPIDGEAGRRTPVGGVSDPDSPFFLAMNRSKRSLPVDLRSDRGQSVVINLLGEADVLVENFRPGVIDRFGLSYDDVREVAPDIVYVSATGWGSSGPYADDGRPGQDVLLQAFSGLALATGRKDDPPISVGNSVVDELAALQVVVKTMMALFHRERTGEGQRVEVNLMDSAIDAQCQEITASLNSERTFSRSEAGVAHPYLPAPYGIYETADSHVAIVSQLPVSQIGAALGVEALEGYEGNAYDCRDEVREALQAYTRTQPTDELVEELLDAGLWAAEVHDYEEMAADPQVEHNEMIIEIDHPVEGEFATTGIPGKLSETPGEVQRPPPVLGEHSAEILEEVGYDPTEIEDLVESGVIATLD